MAVSRGALARTIVAISHDMRPNRWSGTILRRSEQLRNFVISI
jgi:hypothetical protein